jgi:hypothetical protein
MPITEEYLLNNPFGTIQIKRSNTRIDKYALIKSEALGIWNLFAGAKKYFSGFIAYDTEDQDIYDSGEALKVSGKCQFKDGCINIIFSPITWLALGAFAYLRYRSASAPPVSNAVHWNLGPFKLQLDNKS